MTNIGLASEVDPFTQVYTALIGMAQGSAQLKNLIKIGNYVRYDISDNRAPLKDTLSTNDAPELILVPKGITPCNLHSTSSSSEVHRVYSWILNTDDYRASQHLYPLEWALLCAMTGWVTTLTGLRWNGANFVKKCDVQESSAGPSDAQRNRGLKGWSSIWTCSIQMYFKTADMLTFNATPGSV